MGRGIAGFVVGLAMTLGLVGAASAQQVTVFAAASTGNALSEIGRAFEAKGGGKVGFSFAASSALAQQIEQGAPAHVYLSADEPWMAYAVRKGLVDPATRVNLLGNRLVLIAPSDSPVNEATIAPGFPLARLLGGGRLVVGDPDHVPVGIYARQALDTLGVWGEVKDRLARTESARAALALVERGEVPLGIVYATDAAASVKIKVVGRFPADSHPPVTYPVALVAGQANPAAKAFLDYLRSAEAKAVWRKHGFLVYD